MLKKPTRKGHCTFLTQLWTSQAHFSQAMAQTHAEISPVGHWAQIFGISGEVMEVLWCLLHFFSALLRWANAAWV